MSGSSPIFDPSPTAAVSPASPSLQPSAGKTKNPERQITEIIVRPHGGEVQVLSYKDGKEPEDPHDLADDLDFPSLDDRLDQINQTLR